MRPFMGGRRTKFLYKEAMFKRPKPNGKGVVPDHLKDRFRYLDGLAPATALGPWCELAMVAIGGLEHIGFAPNSDLLLVISTSGRGVVDCATGCKIGRDEVEYYPDCGSLEAEGISPLDGQHIRMAGIYGGGLPRTTEDGWLIELHPLSWPQEELFCALRVRRCCGTLLRRSQHYSKCGR